MSQVFQAKEALLQSRFRQDSFGAGPQPSIGRDAPAPSAQLPPAVRQRLEAREAKQTDGSLFGFHSLHFRFSFCLLYSLYSFLFDF